MSSILDQVVQVGVESTYGTAVAPTRAYEAKADTFTRDVEYIQSIGFRRDLQTVRSDRDDTVSLGATGSIECDILNKGQGLLLQHVLGTTSGPTQNGSTTAYKSTFSTDDTGPTGSYTIQMSRVDSGGTLRPFTYEGCVATAFSVVQEWTSWCGLAAFTTALSSRTYLPLTYLSVTRSDISTSARPMGTSPI